MYRNLTDKAVLLSETRISVEIENATSSFGNLSTICQLTIRFDSSVCCRKSAGVKSWPNCHCLACPSCCPMAVEGVVNQETASEERAYRTQKSASTCSEVAQ
ncbi:hypothetical protein GQ600_7974 [Phytophthora cactorum]|nr:hypothetical protein GQ600_7974 [Phytophthora cactorum]